MPEVSSVRMPGRCREADATEIESLVLPLWRVCMSEPQILERIEQRYQWLYRRAPAGPTRTWLVFDPETGLAIGAGSVLPVDYLVGAKCLRAGLLIDFIVCPQARTAGPAVTLQREIARQCAANGFDLLFGYPNRRAWPVMVRAGYEALGTTRTWVRPMAGDVATVLGMLSAKADFSRSAVPGKLVSASTAALNLVFQLGVRLLDVGIGIFGGLSGYRMSIEPLTGDPPPIADRINPLVTRKLIDGYPAWRFAHHPTQRYLLASLTRHGQLRGWIVMRHVEDRVEVQDACWSGENGAARMLWLLLPRTLAQRGIRKLSVSILGMPELDKPLRSAFYLCRDDTRNVVLHLPEGTDPKLAQTLRDCKNWRMFSGEMDI